ncbi:hypothetical protein PAXRUDRAFT_821375 [Paxillus rubicundulus Ve08.2h10]|uniref:Uncharacterized protein n=1 Tax=Paxillus rubicundulus Ve08.2h10 TaxID=930991 RepID=A0A0D0E6L5_9AGAM|nr:hypothetical protein PAXRUDRAFT_821375 [Paxillus rubicundulus Ve08.2h10]
MADVERLPAQSIIAPSQVLVPMASPARAAIPVDAAPVSLSFPAILRNSKLSDRFAHLHISSNDHLPLPRKTRKDQVGHEGKRWVRRQENAKFTHNPHITLPSGIDLAHPLQVPSPTFPNPLPPYLPRNIPISPALHPPPDPSTSSAGLFSLSLRGARRTLRARASSAPLVKAVESHLAEWLEGGTYLNPDEGKGLFHFPGEPVGEREDIREVSREAGRLVWAVKVGFPTDAPGYGDGGFERYVVHCVARWYGVVSFSRETDGHRLTHLLRPNITRPDPRSSRVTRALDTPPTTDASDFHASDANPSDFNVTDGSEYNTTDTSDADSIAGDIYRPTGPLSDIAESRPSSPASWSIIGGSDFQVDPIDSDNDNGSDQGFAASMESLSLSTHVEVDDSTPALPDTTLTPSPLCDSIAGPQSDSDSHIQPEDMTPSRARARVHGDRFSTLYPRATSSPSPVRRSPRRPPSARKLGGKRAKGKAKYDKKGRIGSMRADKGSFYEYLFA